MDGGKCEWSQWTVWREEIYVGEVVKSSCQVMREGGRGVGGGQDESGVEECV